MSEFLNPRRLGKLRTQAFAWDADGTGGAKVGRWLADCAPELIRELDEAQATIARVRKAIEDERAAARRIVDEGRDHSGAWVNLMHSCAMFLMALEPAEPEESPEASATTDLPAVREFAADFDPRKPPAVCTCSSNLMSIHDCAVHGATLECSPGCRIHGQEGEPT
jgi:hypothetical protein